jgi:hypothetical protein
LASFNFVKKASADFLVKPMVKSFIGERAGRAADS